MKKSLILLSLLSSSTLWALGPEDFVNRTIYISMAEAQVSRSGMHQPATLPWYQLKEVTDFVIDFPDSESFSKTVKYSVGLSQEVEVSYTADQKNNQGELKVTSDDFDVRVNLTYTSDTEGTATIQWHQAGNTRHFRHLTFTVQNDFDVAAVVTLPEEIIHTSPEYVVDDGLADILSRLEGAKYRSSTDKLYQKRLVSLLPIILMTGDVSTTSPDFKGNTALHYACGLSDVELVKWLVEHGADLQAYTEKGASVDACVGGKNAARIKAILKEARAWRDKPYTGAPIDEEAAREAAAWLDVEFTGFDMEDPAYDITFNEEKTREAAQLVYRYTKAEKSMFRLGLDQTGTLAGHLSRVLNAKVSEEMFVNQVVRDLKQSRFVMQRVRRGAGLTLAVLPHMILTREDEGMTFDGATAVYRAACEGNAELVRWLISHGADRRLMDEHCKPATLPADTPNLQEVQKALKTQD